MFYFNWLSCRIRKKIFNNNIDLVIGLVDIEHFKKIIKDFYNKKNDNNFYYSENGNKF